MKNLNNIFRTALLFAALVWNLTLQAQTGGESPSVFQTPSPTQSASNDTFKPESNLVLIVRHAIAPGAGDPPGFRMGDCSTQRNLSKDGVLQAQALGRRLNGLGIRPTTIWTSQWCRAIDTAKNLGLGPVQTLTALNSFFANPGQGHSQMQQLEHFLANLDPAKGPYVMVTHQVVITSLTGVFPASGEGVWLRLTGDKARTWVVQPMSGL